MDIKLNELLKVILHGDQGLRIFKYKNSNLKTVGNKESIKGSVFGFRSKDNMQDSRGVVFTSIEALLDSKDEFTHWTPNIYRYGTYVDKYKTIVKGHSEENLRQINTFVVDIDSKEINYGDILFAAHDMGHMPTVILNTPNGFQVYFVLSEPVFVTAKSNFKAVEVAKKISKTIRTKLAAEFRVDLGCNHLGIFRMPRKDNILYADLTNCYSFSEWINWSMIEEDEADTRPALNLLVKPTASRQIDEPWFDLLLHNSKIRGTKGVLGRNNAVLTLALAFFSSGKSLENCEYNLFQFNDQLTTPLEEKEVKNIIASAYSGKYKGASKEYIRYLVHTYVDPALGDTEMFGNRQGRYKVAKPRCQRVRSHYSERKEDLIAYLKEHTSIDKPYFVTTIQEIENDAKIPRTMFYKIRKELKRNGSNEIIFNSKRLGPHSRIIVALGTVVGLALLESKRRSQEQYLAAKEMLSLQLDVSDHRINKILKKISLNTAPKSFDQISLLGVNQP